RRIFPFVWNEALILLNEEGFNQNRLTAGLTAALSPTTRLEAGYMFRSREELGTWFHDHIGVLYLFYDGWGRWPSRVGALCSSARKPRAPTPRTDAAHRRRTPTPRP